MRRLYPTLSKQWQYWDNLPAQATGSVLARLLHGIANQSPAVVFCENFGHAEKLALSTRQFGQLLPDWPYQVLVWPNADQPTLAAETQAEWDKLAVLSAWERYRTGNQATPLLFLPMDAVREKVPPPSSLKKKQCILRVGERIDRNQLAQQLRDWDYHHEAVCEAPGDFAIRGGILDIYPIQEEAPVRIDFFDDEIESIRLFDPTTQRSDESITEIVVVGKPNQQEDERISLAQWVSGSLNGVMIRPSVLEERFPELFEVPETIAPPHPTLADWWENRNTGKDCWFGLDEVPSSHVFSHPDCKKITLDIQSLDTFQASRNQIVRIGEERKHQELKDRYEFLNQLYRMSTEGYEVYCFLRTEADRERIKEIIEECLHSNPWTPYFLEGEFVHGFLWRSSPHVIGWPLREKNSRGVLFTSDADILGRAQPVSGRLRNRRASHKSQVDHLLDFAELADGDFLVHLQHGICQFRGITKIDHRGTLKEVLSLEFADTVILHLPLHESHLITRYVGLTKASPKLDRLGSDVWAKTRRAAERSALDYAAEMLRIQAERATHEAISLSADSNWQRQFEGSFPFRETPDQKKAIEACARDLATNKPMDRLICGDVGFGKTEVALRSAFQAVMGGVQVAVIAPTTVLCQQHFNTFRERMAGYPITVEMLSSFRKPKEQAVIRQQLKQGKIDIIVGTHSLFSKTIEFARLGLMIIDEEHRFGVRQKENLKRLKSTVHCMAMSATPIPRTLYLALMGARDLSVIETAPVSRLPIQTFVRPFDETLIRSAILHEIERGGQVFYLHNRVQSIEKTAQMLQELCPDARIGVGHGQMEKEDLEKIMTRFVAGEYDILVCTTIIESGLDIPNCNTMIIEAADRLGLAQLYQLRGRVGRFNRQAYAYLLLKRHGRVLEHARERLNTIRQNTQLGSGFRIAMRDLELRGAGNVLGVKQSGFIADVGFELYCDLLRQSIARLKGEPTSSNLRATVRLDFANIGEGSMDPKGMRQPVIDAGIPLEYIGETRLRIDYFRKLAMCREPLEIDEIRTEMRDRFGPIPSGVEALLQITSIRCLAESRGIVLVEVTDDILKCRKPSMPDDAPFFKIGNRFPRLQRKSVADRLQEIQHFLQHLNS
jgi:transcription-repair coupling factor (superfamily II helicase)